METDISLPDETYARIEVAAAKLGISCSEFLMRAAERWLEELDDVASTARMNDAPDGQQNARFLWVAAAETAARSEW
jgi:predicted DNA-binding protein